MFFLSSNKLIRWSFLCRDGARPDGPLQAKHLQISSDLVLPDPFQLTVRNHPFISFDTVQCAEAEIVQLYNIKIKQLLYEVVTPLDNCSIMVATHK
jgi:hypothetical protein